MKTAGNTKQVAHWTRDSVGSLQSRMNGGRNVSLRKLKYRIVSIENVMYKPNVLQLTHSYLKGNFTPTTHVAGYSLFATT